jgi:hypothetical protein
MIGLWICREKPELTPPVPNLYIPAEVKRKNVPLRIGLPSSCLLSSMTDTGPKATGTAIWLLRVCEGMGMGTPTIKVAKASYR